MMLVTLFEFACSQKSYSVTTAFPVRRPGASPTRPFEFDVMLTFASPDQRIAGSSGTRIKRTTFIL